MSEQQIKRMVADTFLALADAIETGRFAKQPAIGVAVSGTELGMETIREGVRLAESRGFRATIIDGEDAHKRMETMLECGDIDGAVTMHYPFPIGVSTVGRVVTPGRGREMFLAATTGTSATDRVTAMVKNTIYGIIAAKACGIAEPSVGFANIDGARQTEAALLRLKEGGYPLRFAASARQDGGAVMRGNDLLSGSADVMVMDALTGNLMMKLFSAWTTGGSYESLGFGYGPGIGEGYEKMILIISRASGAPVIAGAVQYASELLQNGMYKIAAEEFAAAEAAGLTKILESLNAKKPGGRDAAAVEARPVTKPEKEVVTCEIHGIEVIDLEDAASALWAEGIYAETGMGCTGPVILVAEAKEAAAREILRQKEYIQ